MNQSGECGPLRETYVTGENLDSVTAHHLELIKSYNLREPEFDPAVSALIVVDMQRFFLEPGYPLYTANGAAILLRVKSLIQKFRKHGRPVIFAAQQNQGAIEDRGEALRLWWPVVPLQGSRQVQVSPELEPLPDEKIIPKRRYSAYFASDLELSLRSRGVRQVVVCGLFTNVCVEATVRDAFMRDFLVWLPADCTASLNEELHLGALRTMAYWFAKVCRAADFFV